MSVCVSVSVCVCVRRYPVHLPIFFPLLVMVPSCCCYLLFAPFSWLRLLVAGTLKLEGELGVSEAIVSSSVDDVIGMAMVSTTAGISWVLHWREKMAVRLGSSHTKRVRALVLASKGAFLGSCGEDGSVRVWNTEACEQIMHFQVADASLCATSMAFSPDVRQCVAGYSNGVLRLFNLETVEMEAKFVPHQTAITGVFFSLDGTVPLSVILQRTRAGANKKTHKR